MPGMWTDADTGRLRRPRSRGLSCRLPRPSLHRLLRAWPAWAVVLLAACGERPSTKAAPPPPTPAAAAKPAGQQAPARPEDTLPRPQCPPRASAAPPGPDIVGLRLGMGLDEALNHARCALPGAVVGFSPRWFQQLQPGRTVLSQQMFTVQRGDTAECSFKQLGDAQKCGLGRRQWLHIDEQIVAAAPGLPGRQGVLAVWRQQHWKPGEMPTREAVLAALREKYGPPSATTTQQHGSVVWRRDTAGRLLTPAEPLFEQCHGPAARATSSQAWREGCGLTVTADLVPARDNPQLVQSLFVGLMDQTAMFRAGETLQAELDRLEAERRADELRQAGGQAPKL